MPCTHKKETEFGDVYFGSFVCSSSDVIIPTDTIENISDDHSLASIVRSLVKHAIGLNIQEMYQQYLQDGASEIEMAETKQLEKELRRLNKYDSQDSGICGFRNAIVSELEKRSSAQIARGYSKNKRNDLAKIYKTVFRNLSNRDGKSCKYCGSTKSLEIDHILPICKGGTNDMDNLQLLCKSCNARKGGR